MEDNKERALVKSNTQLELARAGKMLAVTDRLLAKKTIEGLNAEDWFHKGMDIYTLAIFNRFVKDVTYGMKDAINAFSKAIELKADYPEAYYQRGISYSELDDFKQAADDYTKAIELKPDFILAYSLRGQAYRESGNEEQAINDFKAAARLGHKRSQYALRKQGIDW